MGSLFFSPHLRVSDRGRVRFDYQARFLHVDNCDKNRTARSEGSDRRYQEVEREPKKPSFICLDIGAGLARRADDNGESFRRETGYPRTALREIEFNSGRGLVLALWRLRIVLRSV